MSANAEFVIPYLGLSNGTYQFFFELDKKFFTSFEKSIIEEGQMKVEVSFEKQDRMVVLLVSGSGYYASDCDRCLAPIQVPVDFNDRMIIKIQEADLTQEDEVYYLAPNTSHIDLKPFVHESVLLHLPIKNLRDCQKDEFQFCDQDVLKNLGTIEEEHNIPEGEDPWEALRKLNLE